MLLLLLSHYKGFLCLVNEFRTPIYVKFVTILVLKSTFSTIFINNVCATNAFSDAGVSSVLDKIVAASHKGTWLSTNGLTNIVATVQGTRAGDPFGDIIFAFLCSRVLRKTKNYLLFRISFFPQYLK